MSLVTVSLKSSLDARRHVNRLCLAAEKPLVESGTEGYLGQVTVIHKVHCFHNHSKNNIGRQKPSALNALLAHLPRRLPIAPFIQRHRSPFTASSGPKRCFGIRYSDILFSWPSSKARRLFGDAATAPDDENEDESGALASDQRIKWFMELRVYCL